MIFITEPALFLVRRLLSGRVFRVGRRMLVVRSLIAGRGFIVGKRGIV